MSRIEEIRETLSRLKASGDVTYITGVQDLAEDMKYLLDRLEAAEKVLETIAEMDRWFWRYGVVVEPKPTPQEVAAAALKED